MLTNKWIRTVYNEEWYALFIEAADAKEKIVVPVSIQENYSFINDKVLVDHGNLGVNENVFEILDQIFKKNPDSNEKAVKDI